MVPTRFAIPVEGKERYVRIHLLPPIPMGFVTLPALIYHASKS